MYSLSEQQIDFILRDIKSRGVEMEALQVSLLDHICCIIESELETDGDFESFYRKTISRFFKKELKEIEEETILLLTFKNYYTMKKVMLLSGTFAVAAIILGSFLKIVHWPGANVMLLLGISLASLVFLPLIFILKTKEVDSTRDKLILAIGTLFGIVVSIATLFKLLHWPYANILWLVSLGILFFVFIPLYFFSGIRKPETKINTITSSLLIIIAGGLLFALTSLRPSAQLAKNNMYTYMQNEKLLKKMQHRLPDSVQASSVFLEINNNCDQIKGLILLNEIGQNSLPEDFEDKNLLINERGLGDEFNEGDIGGKSLSALKTAINNYNSSKINDKEKKIPVDHTILGIEPEKTGLFTNIAVLNNMVQIQMYLANSER
jgi:hypothetical protein